MAMLYPIKKKHCKKDFKKPLESFKSTNVPMKPFIVHTLTNELYTEYHIYISYLNLSSSSMSYLISHVSSLIFSNDADEKLAISL